MEPARVQHPLNNGYLLVIMPTEITLLHAGLDRSWTSRSAYHRDNEANTGVGSERSSNITDS